MATTTEHIAARNDADLLDRFIAAAEQAGIPDASAWVQARMGKLVRQHISDSQTVSDVHAYADASRKTYLSQTPPRPGANLSAVTDVFLKQAIETLRDAETAPTS